MVVNWNWKKLFDIICPRAAQLNPPTALGNLAIRFFQTPNVGKAAWNSYSSRFLQFSSEVYFLLALVGLFRVFGVLELDLAELKLQYRYEYPSKLV